MYSIKRRGREEIALREGLTLQEEQNAILNFEIFFPPLPLGIVTRGDFQYWEEGREGEKNKIEQKIK